MNMKSFKRFLFVAFLMLVSTSAFSQGDPLGSLSIKGGVVKCSGGSGTLDVYWKTTNDKILGLDFQVVVPKGIKLSTTASAIKACEGVQMITPGDLGSYYSYTLETAGITSYISQLDGVLISIPFTYDDDFTGGDAVIKEIAVSSDYITEEEDHSAEYYDDVNFTFEFGVATETVTLTKEYNTYVPTKALDFSGVEGIKAYYVTEVTATQATLTETTTVAAGEGIIISGTPDTYEVPVATTEVDKSTTNKLATGTIAEGDYILYDGQFVLCTGGTLPDGKAYLPKSEISTSSAKALILGFGDATGINEAKAAKADGAIYSISGVRVAQPQKGVYIMNGRKVIVK